MHLTALPFLSISESPLEAIPPLDTLTALQTLAGPSSRWQMSQQLHLVIVTLFALFTAASRSFIVQCRRRCCDPSLDLRGRTACHALAQGLATSLPEDLVRGSPFMQQGYNGPQTAQIAAIVFLVKQRFLGLPSLAAVNGGRARGCVDGDAKDLLCRLYVIYIVYWNL